MIKTTSPFLAEIFAKTEGSAGGVTLPLVQITDPQEFEARFLTLFEQPVTDAELFFRIEEDGIILAWIDEREDESGQLHPALFFQKTDTPTDLLGYDPRDDLEEQVKAIAEVSLPRSSVLNNPTTPGRMKRVVGGFRFTVGQRKRKNRDRALNVDKSLKGKRTAMRGLATRIRKAKAWHQSAQGQKMHKAQAQTQRIGSSVVGKMKSFLQEQRYRRYHKGVGSCDSAKDFDRLEEQPVQLRAFLSGLDLALGEATVFLFDKAGIIYHLSASEVVRKAATVAERLEEMAIVYKFPDGGTRDRIDQTLREFGLKTVRRGARNLTVKIASTMTTVGDILKMIHDMGGLRIRQMETEARDLVDAEAHIRMSGEDKKHPLPETLIDLHEPYLHFLFERAAEVFGFESREQMPCGMVYRERASGEVVVSTCEHLLTEAHLEALVEFVGREFNVWEDHYDPMRMLRECALSVLTDGAEIEQVGPRSWVVDDRLVLYSPMSKFMKAYPLGENIPLKEFFRYEVKGQPSNQDSIDASLTNYKILPGIKKIPMRHFDATFRTNYYARDDREHVNAVKAAIADSGWVSPLIVVKDAEGYYVLEGGHRLVALGELGARDLPAMVVLDLDEIDETRKGHGFGERNISTHGRTLGEDVPKFLSYEDALAWIDEKAIEYGSKNRFLASDEYKAAHKIVRQLYREAREPLARQAAQAMTEVGAQEGDRVVYGIVSPFGFADEARGVIVMKQGIPRVKLDSKSAAVLGKRTTRWHKGFQKENNSTNEHTHALERRVLEGK